MILMKCLIVKFGSQPHLIMIRIQIIRPRSIGSISTDAHYLRRKTLKEMTEAALKICLDWQSKSHSIPKISGTSSNKIESTSVQSNPPLDPIVRSVRWMVI